MSSIKTIVAHVVLFICVCLVSHSFWPSPAISVVILGISLASWFYKRRPISIVTYKETDRFTDEEDFGQEEVTNLERPTAIRRARARRHMNIV